MAIILNGKKLRDKLSAALKAKISILPQKPKLAVILVGNDIPSQIYVNNKKKFAKNIGIISDVYTFHEEIDENVILSKIEELNNDDSVNAILVQLPLPEHLDKHKIINTISPQKDVDCFTDINIGKLMTGEAPAVYPCTPKGVLSLLAEYDIPLDGKHVVVVGRSNIVGKPMSIMALNKNATVTICHSHTKNLKDITKTADILISAVGEVLIEEDMVKKDCVVIDIGISRNSAGKIHGDVNFETVSNIASYISPVPGGVGPMTILSLMSNTYELYCAQKKRSL